MEKRKYLEVELPENAEGIEVIARVVDAEGFTHRRLCTVREVVVPENVEALAAQFESRAWCKDINPELDAQMATDLRSLAIRFADQQRELEELRRQLPEGYEVGSLYSVERLPNGQSKRFIEQCRDRTYQATLSTDDSGHPWQLVGDNFTTPADADEAIGRYEEDDDEDLRGTRPRTLR